MKVITLVLDEENDVGPPTIYRQGVSLREAVTACQEAAEALWSELPNWVTETAPSLGEPDY